MTGRLSELITGIGEVQSGESGRALETPQLDGGLAAAVGQRQVLGTSLQTGGHGHVHGHTGSPRKVAFSTTNSISYILYHSHLKVG